MTVQSKLSKTTFKKVSFAACSMCSLVSTSPVTRVTSWKNSTMQQVTTKAISKKKIK